MKKLVAIALVLSMMLTFAACTGAPANDDALFADGKFTVGFDQDFPPYGYVGEDGEFTGFDIEMAKKAAELKGWEIDLVPIDWNYKDAELDSGTIDCIWNGFTMNGREDLYTWTEAYMDNSQVVVVKKDSGITTLADLAGKNLTVQLDSSAEDAINSEDLVELKASLGALMTCPEYNTAFMDLEAGAVDAIAMDYGVAKFQVEGREDMFVILEEDLVAEQYGIGVKLGNEQLRDELQDAYDKLCKDGTTLALAEQFGVADGLILR